MARSHGPSMVLLTERFLHFWHRSSASLRQLAVENRDKMAAKMMPDQIAEVQRLAREWKPTK